VNGETRIRFNDLVSGVDLVLEAAGVPREVRSVEARLMAEADLLGVPSHGVRMLPALVQALMDGRVNPNPDLKVLTETGAVCLLDCDNGPGRYVSVKAMDQAVRRAQAYGVGVCSARRTTHWGRAHAYACRAAQAGLIGFCTTNAIPNMVAWGASRPVLGNNPLAIAVPRGAGRDPVVLDMAMSQAAVGKVGTYLREGRRVPPGWGLDSAGHPTDDAAAILEGGRLLPCGDHKGAGLALMMEILTGGLAGGWFSHEIVKADPSGTDPESCKFFLALRIESFGNPDAFYRRLDDLMTCILAEADPGTVIQWPGDRGWRTRDLYMREGVPIHADIVRQLCAMELPGGGDLRLPWT
jgi:LDH2 family malate/lactate/ureidoglycolate dehydrogenase